jgi:hypothetical protein
MKASCAGPALNLGGAEPVLNPGGAEPVLNPHRGDPEPCHPATRAAAASSRVVPLAAFHAPKATSFRTD